MPYRMMIVEGVGWVSEVKIHICKHCGAEAEDLENNICVEWWGEEECGCHREGA